MTDRDVIVSRIAAMNTSEREMFDEIAEQNNLNRNSEFEMIMEIMDKRIEESKEEYDDSMDGDHASALTSAGFGVDEDYSSDEVL